MRTCLRVKPRVFGCEHACIGVPVRVNTQIVEGSCGVTRGCVLALWVDTRNLNGTNVSTQNLSKAPEAPCSEGPGV